MQSNLREQVRAERVVARAAAFAKVLVAWPLGCSLADRGVAAPEIQRAREAAKIAAPVQRESELN